LNAALPSIAGIPIDFILFACTLAGVALFHKHVLKIAVTGLIVITLYKLLFSPFASGAGVPGLMAHLGHEWVIVANLFALLVGFALLSKFLPDDWKGGFVLLILVFVISSFLDNIAAAMIGGTVAAAVFKKRVHIGYLAAIVAASNAGGAGSVVGDTTTTMIWIAGGSPLQVLDAYVAAVPALLFFSVIAARQQHAYQPITRDAPQGVKIDGARLAIVAIILLSAIGANVYFNLRQPQVLDHVPVIGVAVLLAIIVTSAVRTPDWRLIPDAVKGSVFLLSLVLCASMMPVEKLPLASWPTSLGLGFISAVFDNIPLTALALKQGGYDWGFLAYAVGFGGSMIWFGSSAGVALSNSFPEARSVGQWLRHGWHVAVGYVLGFFILLAVLGWHPEPLRKSAPTKPAAASTDRPHAIGSSRSSARRNADRSIGLVQ
jgi:Na+/H+ antiporter NhaD/arsenite permease-like protein